MKRIRLFRQKIDREYDSTERSLISPMEMRQPGLRISYLLMLLFLFLLTLSCIFPMYWMYTGGLKTSTGLLKFPPELFPSHPIWSNYLRSWTELNFPRYFANTIGLAAGAWTLQIVISTTAAYSLSRLKPAYGNVILTLFLTTLMVPPMAYLIPQYLTVVKVPLLNISLLDSWWGVWLPQAVSAFNIFVMKNFFDEIPHDLTDAAVIDGASALRVLWDIILPLSKPVLAVITIFTVIGTWKDFFWPYLILMGNTEAQPIMVALYYLTTTQSYPQPFNIVMAGLAIASTPPLILFFIFQKQIMRGITLTGLKG
jgi:multiple sugar transport system permease protein